MSSPSRAGFSLMEVLMATSILLASVIILGELASIGRRQASAARDLATAQLLCENKVSEILSGAASAVEVDGDPIEENPGWMYAVELKPVNQFGASGPRGLVALKVTVAPEDIQVQRPESERHAVKEFSLVRWIRDPKGSPDEGPGFANSEVSRLARQSGAGQAR